VDHVEPLHARQSRSGSSAGPSARRSGSSPSGAWATFSDCSAKRSRWSLPGTEVVLVERLGRRPWQASGEASRAGVWGGVRAGEVRWNYTTANFKCRFLARDTKACA
jgi:hypothetical protein